MSKPTNSGNQPPSTPRWVKISGIIIVALIVLFIILKLTGIGGNHGPGRHFSTAQAVQSDQIMYMKQDLIEGPIHEHVI
ncbi:hypothetical protein ACFFHF_13465 [Robertmurraya beringensis]|uniref:Uncharacterized protein n=1 Tax=Robertmurraya beringensis TaxID=641660 RepID=A0ABV6KSD4_9BACI